MKKPRRIYAWDLAHEIGRGPDAPIVVCASSEPARLDWLKADGSLSLTEFESRLASVPTNHKIVFYCSSPEDAVATERAEQCQAKGFTRVQVLNGGMEAWNAISVFRRPTFKLESRSQT